MKTESDELRFVMFSSTGSGTSITDSGLASYGEVLYRFKRHKDRSLIDLWMQKTRRGEYFNTGSGIILCVSGRRRITRGMNSEQLKALVGGVQ